MFMDQLLPYHTPPDSIISLQTVSTHIPQIPRYLWETLQLQTSQTWHNLMNLRQLGEKEVTFENVSSWIFACIYFHCKQCKESLRQPLDTSQTLHLWWLYGWHWITFGGGVWCPSSKQLINIKLDSFLLAVSDQNMHYFGVSLGCMEGVWGGCCLGVIWVTLDTEGWIYAIGKHSIRVILVTSNWSYIPFFGVSTG